jgi:hypothetical protein
VGKVRVGSPRSLSPTLGIRMPRKPFSPPKGWTEYRPGRRVYPDLTPEQAAQLERVPAARRGDVAYRPCELTLRDASVIARAYILDASTYIRWWGAWPGDDRAKTEVDISDVVSIRECPDRLPVRFADVLYTAGESSMGGVVFTLVFAGGLRQVYETGNLVDFIPYPFRLSPRDIVSVEPHNGRGAPNRLQGLSYSWCLYGVGESNTRSWHFSGDA